MANPNVTILSELVENPAERELGAEAVFTISSAKPGNGVEQLRDNNLDTYWQSDGTFPHTINIQFPRRVNLTRVGLYLNYSMDETYTPKKLALSVGTCTHDLVDIITTELQEPSGWVIFSLDGDAFPEPVRCHFIQVRLISMHQNGKDTHVRQLKVFGSRSPPRVMAGLYHDDFQTVEMAQFCVLR